jgi:plasmid maintenance system antidote protein VapI
MLGRRGVAKLLSEQLREFARSAGTVYRVAKESGVSQPALQRFVYGGESISMGNADELATYLGLALKPKRQGR